MFKLSKPRSLYLSRKTRNLSNRDRAGAPGLGDSGSRVVASKRPATKLMALYLRQKLNEKLVNCAAVFYFPSRRVSIFPSPGPFLNPTI